MSFPKIQMVIFLSGTARFVTGGVKIKFKGYTYVNFGHCNGVFCSINTVFEFV
jgi:hypothetical protein